MRYAILSDIHANFAALQAVDHIVQRLRLQNTSDGLNYWFLGDVLGYGPEPLECLRWLRYRSRIGERWVPGNHDVEVYRMGMSALPPGGGTSSQALRSWEIHFELLRRPENQSWWEWWMEEIARAVDDEARSLIVEEHGSLVAIFVHASITTSTRRTQYLYPWAEYRTLLGVELQRLWEQYGGEGRTVCLFHGHTHFPILARLQEPAGLAFQSVPYGEPIELREGCYAINPGSVGQPRDGDPRAAFAVLDVEDRTITYQRAMYDQNSTVHALEAEGYPGSLVHLLATADGGANLAYYREVYRAPRLHILETEESRQIAEGVQLQGEQR